MFKPGDKVLCMKDQPALGVQRGNIYQVIEIHPIGSLIRLMGAQNWFDTDKFIMASQTAQATLVGNKAQVSDGAKERALMAGSRPVAQQVSPMATAGVCIHKWVEYNGFTEYYEYCEKCDKKKEKL